MSINNIISRNFPGINALTVSMVEETEPKDFHTRYFFFLRAIPSIKSDTSSTGRTYDTKSSINFKMEAEKLLSLSFALEQYALGKGKIYEDVFGSFTVFADGSKSQFGSGGKKSMFVSLGTNNKNNKSLINIFFSESERKIPFFFTPYEAHSIAVVFETLAKKCIDMELSGGGIVMKKPPFKSAQEKVSQNNFDEDPFQPSKQEQSEMNKVTNQFSNFFSNDPFDQ